MKNDVGSLLRNQKHILKSYIKELQEMFQNCLFTNVLYINLQQNSLINMIVHLNFSFKLKKLLKTKD